MRDSKVMYQEPEMEILLLFDGNVYTDPIQASNVVPEIGDNWGEDYDSMFG